MTGMASPAYAELHCISCFSFLRGASHPEELVARAAELGYAALALTDHCSFAGIVRAHLAAREAGLQFIVGTELRLVDGLRLVLLAADRAGYGAIARLITQARRRAPKGAYRVERPDLDALPAGCIALWPFGAAGAGRSPAAEAAWLRECFGDRAWLALNLRCDGRDRERLAAAQALAVRSGLPCCATGDVLMHRRSRRALQDLVTAIRLGVPLAEAGHALQPNGERHLRSRTRLARLYPAAWLEATLAVAGACRFSLDELRYQYPEDGVPPGETATTWLGHLTRQGMRRRWPRGVPARVRRQVERELALIAELGYEHYFLTVHDLVRFARERGILCQGRGSAANSAVCFCLGITEVDPARIDTLFERFISRERGEPPDIDVDFEHERREEVMQYIYRRYGRDRAALTASVIRYRPRSALRDAGKALGLDPARVDRLARGCGRRGDDWLTPGQLREAGLDPDNPQVRRFAHLATELVGLPRHLSQHVGGFVIARGPLCELVPIENAAMPERSVIQWDKDDLDALGLLKIDVLALGMLTAIRKAFDLIEGWNGQRLSIAGLPAEDPEVYRMIQEADTVGVFQIESRAQRAMLPRLRPACFYDLVIEVAIVRPGPIQGDMVHPYLRRRQGLEPVDYPGPAVRRVLERTLGVPIFQEQVIRLAMVAAGFSAGEADRLRRAMAAWRRRGGLEPFEQRLIEGMRARGYSEDFARAIYRQILGFGEYGFPESHAASFALLVYASAWLKCHHPAAFAAALLNSQPMGFYSPAEIVQDVRRHGVEVRPVDVRASGWDCTLETAAGAPALPALRLGLRLVKGLSRAGARRLLAARARAPLRRVAELVSRARLDRGDLEALAAAGALAGLAGNRHQARWACAGVEPSLPLFAQLALPETTPLLPPPTEGEDLVADYASLGLTLGRHPLALLRDRLRCRGVHPLADLGGAEAGQRLALAGLVTCRQRPASGKGVVFLSLEDETGQAQVVVWPDLARRHRRCLQQAGLMLVWGEVQREGEVVHLLARRLEDRSTWLGRLAVPSRDFH